MRRRELIRGLSAFAMAGSMRLCDVTPVEARSDELASSPHSESTAMPATVAGVRLVDSAPAKAATQVTRSVSPPYLFNHAIRTFLFGSLMGRALGKEFDAELLYLACILHDLGLTEKFEGDLPFEIQGAQAAKRFLEEQGYDIAKTAVVWDGIAMHASLIGQFKQPEVALVGAGAGADVLGPDSSQVTKSEVHEILTAFPRLGFKDAFINTCADVVRRHPNGAAHSFMRDIGERYVSGYHAPNFCDAVTEAPFSDQR